MKELITFRKYLNEGVVKEDEFDDLLDSGLSYKEIKAKHKDKLRAAAIAYLEGDEGDDYDDILKKLDDFDDEEGIKKAPKKQRKPGELGDLNHADGTPKSNDELDAELNDEIDNLSKDMFNEEIEKEDIDNMDDLELNSDYYEAIGDVRDTAVWNSATDLAKEYGFDSYQDYYDKAYENPDDEINHDHYQEEFLPVARENARVDYKVLDRAVAEFLKYYNVTFDVDLRKLFYTEAKNDFGSWQ